MDFSNYSLMVLKPDALEECLDPVLISGIESRGLNIVFRKIVRFNREQAETLYGEKKGINYFDKLMTFMTESQSLVLIVISHESNATETSQEYRNWVRKNLKKSRFELNKDDLNLLNQGIHPNQHEITREMALRSIMHVSDDPASDINYLAKYLSSWDMESLKSSDPCLHQHLLEQRRKPEGGGMIVSKERFITY